ncbi:MAG: DUF4870 domain-containing protein [Cyclobacteriaceae bacterium]
MTEKQWVVFSHLGTLLGYVVAFGSFVIPLVIWLSKKEESKLIEEHSKESLNFQISMAIYTGIAGIFSILLIGLPFLFALIVVNIICVVIATVKADKGEFYRYPATIRFIQ